MNESNTSPTGQRESASAPSPGSNETSRVVDKARSEMENLKESARKEGSAAVDQIKSAAQSAVRDAQETGQSFVKNQKENLASRFSEYAQAVQSMSEKLRGDNENILVGPAEQAAGSLNRISDYLREKEPAELLDDLESLARQKPELVFGGLFVVGFAAARFFKASRRQRLGAGSMALSTHVEAPDRSLGAGALSQPHPYPPVPPAPSVGIS
jgi:gas vesicle protein